MSKDMLSQEEIDFLLNSTEEDSDENLNDETITEIEIDALGEIGNISMGTAATTLSTLLNNKVTITTPKVEITTTGELDHEYPTPFVAVDVQYKEGLEGSNILMINVDDVKIITDIMMGKDEFDLDRELTDLDLSAVSEVMNQMMGSAVTSLSEIFSKKIDIAPPKSYEITFSEGKEKLEVLKTNKPIIKVSFKMIVKDLIDSELMQLIPLNFGQEMVENLLGKSDSVDETTNSNDLSEKTEKEENNIHNEIVSENLVSSQSVDKKSNINDENNNIEEEVVVKKPKFETFDAASNTNNNNKNESIDLVGDIPVELTAELGRANKRISEILKYGPGTVIELDKLVGEPLNIYANGKFIAKGEVVVIDDNFGIRITNIEDMNSR